MGSTADRASAPDQSHRRNPKDEGIFVDMGTREAYSAVLGLPLLRH